MSECPSTGWEDYDWTSEEGWCFQMANGTHGGVCGAISCECESYAMSGLAYEMKCPVNDDGSPCGEASGLGRCEPAEPEQFYNEERDSIPGECVCASPSAGPRHGCGLDCDKSGAACNDLVYKFIDGYPPTVSACSGASGARTCFPRSCRST